MNKGIKQYTTEKENNLMEFQSYLIIYNYDEMFKIDNAVSFKDCIIQFLSHTGDNTPLLVKALKGMDTEVEMIKLVTMMSGNTIQYVCKVEKTIYDWENARVEADA